MCQSVLQGTPRLYAGAGDRKIHIWDIDAGQYMVSEALGPFTQRENIQAWYGILRLLSAINKELDSTWLVRHWGPFTQRDKFPGLVWVSAFTLGHR